MIASTLAKYDFLISPNFSCANAQRSVLVKYQENGIKIATSAVFAISKQKNPNQPISERIFNWMLQACGYALRINDQKNSDSFFQQSMVLYLSWLKEFPFTCETELKEKYIRIMMLHLSQIFVNPSFENNMCYIFINKIQSGLIAGEQKLSNETWSDILKVMLYGNSELFKQENIEIEESTKVGFSKITIDLLCKCEIYPNDSFWSQFDEQLNELFQSQLFCRAWVNKFSELYILRMKKQNSNTSSNNEMDYLNFLIQFFKKKIDTEFNEANKQQAFTTVVYSWNLFSKESVLLLYNKWNLEQIKEMILPWFSINVEWKHDETINATHPLFLLLQMGEGQLFNQKDNQLQEIATQIVRKALSDKSKSDLFWFFPQYSYFFLVKNPKLLNEIKDEFIYYVHMFKESEYASDVKLNIYIDFILVLLIEQKKEDKITANSLAQLLVPATNNFTVYIVSLICLLLIKNHEFFWPTYNSILNIHEFDDVVDVLSLISSFSPHLNGPNFLNNFTLNSNIWNYLYSPQSIYYRERLILSMFFLSEGSDYFIVNPDDGAALLQYFLVKDEDTKTFPALANFFKMTRLSIICGGALNSNELEDMESSEIPPKSPENFMTKSYIVSTFNSNFIKIRHGLGSTIFSVQDSIALLNEDEHHSAYSPQPVERNEITFDASSAYSSKCEPATELLEAVERMDALFVSNSDFIPYKLPDEIKVTSPAQGFLCDSGFISSFSEKNIRKIPISSMTNSIEAKLDFLEPLPIIKIPIIQVSDDSSLFSRETEALRKLVQVDLKKVQTKVCKLDFIIANDDVSSLFTTVEKYGFCILLNESGLLLNHSCNRIKANVIISLIQDTDYYIVDMIFSQNLQLLEKTARRKLFGIHKLDDMSFAIPNDLLSGFISLAALIFYSSNPYENEKVGSRKSISDAKNEAASEAAQLTDVDEQTLGPQLFVSGYKKRMDYISEEYERSNQGRMPLLIEITQE